MRWPCARPAGSLLLSMLLLALLAGPSAGAEPAKAPAPETPAGVVDGLYQGPGGSAGSHQIALNGQTLELGAAADEVRQKLALARAGDKISLRLDSPTAPKSITKIEKISRPVGRKHRLMAMAASLLGLFLVALFFTRGKPQALILGKDQRYSNSQVQMALWFAVTATVYCATLTLRYFKLGYGFLGGIGIPENVLILSGLSAFSFGGAKVITVQKALNAEKAAAAPAPAAGKPAATAPAPDPGPSLLRDLVQSYSGQYDLGDFQMLLVTLAAVVIFGVSGYHFLGSLPVEYTTSLPDIDTTLLSGFGIGQGAYLVKKAAAKLGEG